MSAARCRSSSASRSIDVCVAEGASQKNVSSSTKSVSSKGAAPKFRMRPTRDFIFMWRRCAAAASPPRRSGAARSARSAASRPAKAAPPSGRTTSKSFAPTSSRVVACTVAASISVKRHVARPPSARRSDDADRTTLRSASTWSTWLSRCTMFRV